MNHTILTTLAASITDLKKHPMQTINDAKGEALAILNRNEPVFYCVPAKMYEAMLDAMEDAELCEIVQDRQKEESVQVSIHDL